MNIFKLPDLGEGLTEAEIVSWHVQAGDEIKEDQPLVSVETAKVIVDIPSPCSGRVQHLFGKSGDLIHTGDPLAEFAIPPGDLAEMTDIHPFVGQFDLRDWQQSARPIETRSGAIAWELAGALVSCKSAVLTLAVGKPKLQLMIGGARKWLTPIDGSLRVDKRSISLDGNLEPDDPARTVGSLQMQNACWLELDLRLQQDRLTATLYARSTSDKPVQMQVFRFHRVGVPDAPPRRAPEKAPAPLIAPSPPAVTSAPLPDPVAQLVAEWTKKLRNTQLTHEENDSQIDYGGSTYFERRTVLRLLDDRFVLDRSTRTRVSIPGLSTPPSTRHSQRTGTWSVLATAGTSRVRLQLTCSDGEQLSYAPGKSGGGSLDVDGSPWQWQRVN